MANDRGDDLNSTFGVVLSYVAGNNAVQICWDIVRNLPSWLFHAVKICIVELLRFRTFGILVLLLFTIIIVLQVARTFYMRSTMRTTTLMSGSNFAVRRFRKRDKLRYYYERMFRKLRRQLRENATGRKAIALNVAGEGSVANASSAKSEAPDRRKRITKRRVMTDFARTIFRPAGTKPTSANTMPDSLPANLLVEENDIGMPSVSKAASKFEFDLPHEIIAMMRAVRVLGHFEEPIYVELLKRMETIELEYGQYLFKAGDPDDAIYMVQRGRLLLYIETPKYQQPILAADKADQTDVFGRKTAGGFAKIDENPDSTAGPTPPRPLRTPRADTTNRSERLSSRVVRFPLKIIEKGEPVNSLLSILDVITGHARPFRTLNAKALETSTVLRLPVSVLNKLLEKDTESLMRVVQIVMSRLQRVIFMALHHYLGLSHELLSSHATYSLAATPKTSVTNTLPRETMSEKRPVEVKITTPVADGADDNKRKFRKRGYSTDEQMSSAGFYPTSKNISPLRPHLMPLRSSPSVFDDDDEDGFSQQKKTDAESSRASSFFNVSDKFFSNDEDSLSSDSDDILGHDYSQRHQRKTGVGGAGPRGTGGGSSSFAFLQRSRSFGGSDLVDIPRDARFNDALSILNDLLQLGDEDDDENDAENETGGRNQMLRYIRVATDTRIIHEHEPDSGVAFVVSGGLLMTQQSVEPTVSNHRGANTKLMNGGIATAEMARHDSPVMRLGPGMLAGVLAVLSGEPSVFTCRAYEPSKLIYITRNDFYELIKRRPRIVLPLAHTATAALTPFVRQVDFAIDWLHVEAGRALYRQGDDADCIYIVLSGRLRSIISRQTAEAALSSSTSEHVASDNNNHRKPSHSYRRQSTMQWQQQSPPNVTREIVGEFGRGELVGLVEVSIGQPRTTTVMAVRDSEVARLPAQVLELMKVRYPKVVTRLINILARSTLGGLSRQATGSNTTSSVDAAIISIATASGGGVGTAMSGAGGRSVENDAANTGATSAAASTTDSAASPQQQNLATVAIYAAHDRVPLDSFVLELELSIRPLKPCLRVTSEFIVNLLGSNALSQRIGNYRLSAWLDRQEDHHLLILQCDRGLTQWTKHCFRQADLVIMLANGTDDPNVLGAFETQLEGENLNIRARRDLVLLYHMEKQFPKRTAAWVQKRPWVARYHHIKCHRRIFRNRSVEKFEELYYRSDRVKPDVFSDFSRLARHITCQQVGLVLGGGGARGAAHVGVIKCLLENGIPIDMVGGTSMGAFVGAVWAQDRDLTQCVQDTRTWFQGAASLWKTIVDITYPITALFSGVVFNASIEDVFEADRQIEDLWLPYFCISTDITNSQMRVHTCGSLWRYVRASMTLAGYLPPICDPRDSHLLVDGGYVNNLPADVMRQLGASIVIASDVSSKWELEVDNYGDAVSGWWLLANKWNPFAKRVRIPSMGEIQTRLAFVSCMRQMELIKRSKFMIYIRPPVERYETLQFKEFDSIMDVGYKYASKFFSDAESSKRVAELFRFPSSVTTPQPATTGGVAASTNDGSASTTPAETTGVGKEEQVKSVKSAATAPVEDKVVSTAGADTPDAATTATNEQQEVSTGSGSAVQNRKKAGNLLSAMWAEKDRIAAGHSSGGGGKQRAGSPSRLEHRDSLGGPIRTFHAPIYQYSFTDLAEMVSQQDNSSSSAANNSTTMYGNRRRQRGHSSEGSSSRKSESEAETIDVRRTLLLPPSHARKDAEDEISELPPSAVDVVWPPSLTSNISVRTSRLDNGDSASVSTNNSSPEEGGLILRSIVRKPSSSLYGQAAAGDSGNDSKLTNDAGARVTRRRSSSADRASSQSPRKGVAFALPTMSDTEMGGNTASVTAAVSAESSGQK